MPVEIDELLVTAHIAEGASGGPQAAAASGSGGPVSEEVKLQIIEEAVKQVMYLLERQKDR
jgi:hypothetical protein